MSNLFISNNFQYQIPEYIREENPTFVTFLKKYYEWMELNGNIYSELNKLGSISDIDLTESVYLDKIKEDLIPHFPQDILLDKTKFLKIVSSFYKSKGTQDSIKFLFRLLYNEDIDLYYPKEQVLKLSDGKWTLPLALRVSPNDVNILNTEKTQITGQTSKATAIIEKAVESIDRQLGVRYVELYISNVSKLFQTGETLITHVTGDPTTPVSTTLIGSLSEIKINPLYRGLYYNGYNTDTGYEGDPVTIIGGLNPNSANPIGAVATVGEVLKGSVKDIVIKKGGFGFRLPTLFPETSIVDFKGGFENTLLGQEAKASIQLLDETYSRNVNVAVVNVELYIGDTINQIDNIANNKTINELTEYDELQLFSIAYLSLSASGGGYKSKPGVEIYSFYNESNSDLLVIPTCTAVRGTNVISDFSQDLTNSFEIGEYVRLFVKNKFENVVKIKSVSTNTLTLEQTFQNDIDNLSVYKILRNQLNNLGALGKLNILDGGDGYQVGEYLIFNTIGRGYGANAVITQVHGANNGIKSVEFLEANGFLKGGEGYDRNYLPTVTINTVSGANASIVVEEILGEGQELDISTTKIGAISTLRVTSYGYDYSTAPTISLRNADIRVANVTSGQIFVSNTRVYQGASNTNSSWYAFIDTYDRNEGLLRVYNYSGSFNINSKIYSDDNIVDADPVSINYYGDGKAKATAKFENGLIRYPGIYLNSDGQPSADMRLQDSNKYHNFSYVINTEKDYSVFKKPLKDIVHPAGTKVFVLKNKKIQKKSANASLQLELITINSLSNTVNIVNGTNHLISTGISGNLQSVISVGDQITLLNVTKKLQGNVSISTGSNVVVGNATNFINDVMDGDRLFIQVGANTVTVSEVVNANTIYTTTELGNTATGSNITLIYNESAYVSFVNANTILVDTIITSDSNTFVSINIKKVE